MNRCSRELRQGLWNAGVKLAEGIDSSGQTMAWMLDCREVLLSTRYLRCAGRLIWERVRGYAPDMVGGLTMSADPLTVATLYEAAADGRQLDGFVIRKEPKRYGLEKLIEGPSVRPGAKVVLLDDVVCSGQSLQRAHRVVTSAGGQVVGAAVLVDFQRPSAIRRLQRLGIPVEAVFTLDDLGLALATPTGKASACLSWRYQGVVTTKVRLPHASPCHDAQQDGFIIGSDGGFAVALDRDGGERWRYPAEGAIGAVRATPVVTAGRVVFGDSDGVVHCLEAETGAPRWTYQAAGRITRAATVDSATGRVLFGVGLAGGGGLLLGLRIANGSLAWTMALRGAPNAGPVVDAPREQVILGLGDGSVCAVRGAEGRERWRLATGADVRGQPVVSPDGTLIVGGYDGFVHAIEAAVGKPIWRRRLSSWLFCSPALVDDTVVVGADQKVVALDLASGTIVWIAAVRGRVIGGPTVVDGRWIVVGSEGGDITLINARTGSVAWTHLTDGPVRATPVAEGGTFAVPSGDGHLYAFELVPPPDSSS